MAAPASVSAVTSPAVVAPTIPEAIAAAPAAGGTVAATTAVVAARTDDTGTGVAAVGIGAVVVAGASVVAPVDGLVGVAFRASAVVEAEASDVVAVVWSVAVAAAGGRNIVVSSMP